MSTVLKYTDFPLSEESQGKFELFYNILIEENKKYNLTAIEDEKEVYIKHFSDSVKGVDSFPYLSTVIEIGSGAGFPSVPLMIVRKDLKFTLVESVVKKCKFLEIIRKKLGLNFEILNARAEDLAKKKEYREVFDVSTARAVARLNTLCEYCLPFVKKGGKFIAYKGDAEEEIKEAMPAIKILGGKLISEEKYSLSENAVNRTIITIEKIKNTPSLYPRGNGKERKKPII